MYRCVNYNPFNESVFLRTWTDAGDRIDTEIPFRPYLYVEKDGAVDATSIFKTPLVKKMFKNSIERKKFTDGHANKRFFHNIGPEQQFLIEMYKDSNNGPDFSKFALKTFFIDIELDMSSAKGFPTPEKAREPINLITVYDTLTKSTHTWGLEKAYTSTLEDCIYHRCKDEEDLILQFVDFWKVDHPDIVSGWNSAGFDLPYIINRCINLFGEDFLSQFSPVGRVHSRKIYTADGKEQIRWLIGGISCIDYMEIYKTFSVGERESYSLNYISETELGEGKIAFNAASLGELATNDWKTFVDYNIQDVHLLVKLENKLKYLQIVRLLAYKGCTNLEAALGKIAIVTGAVAIQAHKQGFIIPTFGVNNDRESYEGGYVKDPERGLQTSIVSFDVNSLYPNTIITLNISPETKIGKIVTGDFDTSEEITIKLVNGKLHTTKVESFKKFLVSEKMSISKAGVLYSQKSKGVIPNLIDEIYKERVDIQKQLHKLELAKATDEVTLSKIIYFDTLQYTLKIFLNSIYGTFANKHSSMMDIDNAMSITMTGQNVAKAGSSIIDAYIKANYGIDNKSATIYQDTDSVVGETVLKTNIGELPIETLYDNFIDSEKTISYHGHEIIDVENKGLKLPTFCTATNKVVWGNVKNLVRHKVSKKKYKINVGGKEIIMTEDHGCMVLRSGQLLRISPKDINLDTDKMVIIN